MKEVTFWYKNHKGQKEERHVIPEELRFELEPHGDYHEQPGWCLVGFDLDRQAIRTFQLSHIMLPEEFDKIKVTQPRAHYLPIILKFEV